MSDSSIKLLDRYRVDRTWGVAAMGPERLVILMLKANDGPEIAYAISKVDAMMIGMQLTAAASEVKAETGGV